MPTYKTYRERGAAKLAGNMFLPGSGQAVSALTAKGKADLLNEILQKHFQAGGMRYSGGDIGRSDVKEAIAYVIAKKNTKAIRQGVNGAAKFGIAASGLTVGATLGSVVPVLGTAVGGTAGYVAGAGAGSLVGIADQTKRKLKWGYKKISGTQGKHREQAAECLAYMALQIADSPASCAAHEALGIILHEEFDMVMAAGPDLERIAKRMKSV